MVNAIDFAPFLIIIIISIHHSMVNAIDFAPFLIIIIIILYPNFRIWRWNLVDT